MEDHLSKLSFDEIKANYDELNNIITKYFNETNDEKWIDKAKKLLQLHEDFADKIMLAPASGNPALHNAFPGGYVLHTINVINFSLLTYRMWKFCGINLTDEMRNELVFCAATHDLGKVGNFEHEYYVPETSKWHIENMGRYYRSSKEIPMMRLQDRTLWLLQNYNIVLSENEYISILVHDGMYDEGNKTYYTQFDAELKFKTAIPYILHHADMMSTRLEFEQWYLPFKESEEKTKPVIEQEIKLDKRPEVDDEAKKQNLINEFSNFMKTV